MDNFIICEANFRRSVVSLNSNYKVSNWMTKPYFFQIFSWFLPVFFRKNSFHHDDKAGKNYVLISGCLIIDKQQRNVTINKHLLILILLNG